MLTKKMLRRKLRLIFMGFAIPALIIGSLTGCAADGVNNGHRTNDQKSETYGHDGYMGYSNSNPNMPNKLTFLNYDSDRKLINQVLQPIEGIKNSRVSFNGEDLNVRIKANPSLTDAEVEALQAKAQQVVQLNMPRYHVKVKASR
ncbi:hypothetical protein SAMN05216378_0009 [Paenibacillus catalpae]|uniref:Sporulation lipoprotein YhcN/YlaJ (Spore_YhcN_YlaJ) n=1 Tax=Paenibacillus catalpae TaxID=1045775 RepID=A0A1I2HWH0_9BACL|nr:hypothetical protein [Paenibacillus catalpae]SFF34495.1 hypothetical protein SAMN05216378_0009 [Paenibacillus catalpae]